MKKLSMISALGVALLSTALLPAGATQMPSNATATDQAVTPGQTQAPVDTTQQGTNQGMQQDQDDEDVIIIEEDDEENDQAPSA
jgi:hypothetical protein